MTVRCLTVGAGPHISGMEKILGHQLAFDFYFVGGRVFYPKARGPSNCGVRKNRLKHVTNTEAPVRLGKFWMTFHHVSFYEL